MINVARILELQERTVRSWHTRPIANEGAGFLADVCSQHSYNYLLWHEEDHARSPDADDSVIADVKRAIDKYNQQRNDWIEKVDDRIAEMMAEQGVKTESGARLNSETPGSIIDRLSILALRLYHLHEDVSRTDVSDEHRSKVQERIAVCLMQRDDLANCLTELLEDIFAGRYRHRTYRQLKMYNDPSLNPYLYKARSNEAAAGESKVVVAA